MHRGLVPAWRLPLPALQVQEPLGDHELEELPEGRIDAGEDLLRPRGELPGIGERPEGRPAERVHPKVPGPEPINPQRPAADLVDPVDHGHHVRLHRPVEPEAVFRRVVEPPPGTEGVLPVVGKPRVPGDLLPEGAERVVQVFQHLPVT